MQANHYFQYVWRIIICNNSCVCDRNKLILYHLRLFMECLVLWLLETVSIPFLTFLTSTAVSMAWEPTPRDAMSMSNNRDNYTPRENVKITGCQLFIQFFFLGNCHLYSSNRKAGPYLLVLDRRMQFKTGQSCAFKCWTMSLDAQKHTMKHEMSNLMKGNCHPWGCSSQYFEKYVSHEKNCFSILCRKAWVASMMSLCYFIFMRFLTLSADIMGHTGQVAKKVRQFHKRLVLIIMRRGGGG